MPSTEKRRSATSVSRSGRRIVSEWPRRFAPHQARHPDIGAEHTCDPLQHLYPGRVHPVIVGDEDSRFREIESQYRSAAIAGIAFSPAI